MSDSGLHKVSVAIIGAGVIGLAVAARLAQKHRNAYVLEKNESFGLETSSRNSETIHAGIYYARDSLKATTCVAGNALLYELCAKHGVACLKTGKLIVATREEEMERLEALLATGRQNGVEGLQIISRSEVKRLEPNVEAIAAIHVPSSGIIDSHALMRFYLARAREAGAEIAYLSKVVGIEHLSDGYAVTVEDSQGSFTFRTEVLVNCAGLQSDTVAQLAGIDIDRESYRLHFCKGEYFSVSSAKQNMVSRLIYPVPEPGAGGTGIHNVFDVERRMRLGPNARYLDDIDYRVDPSQKQSFFEAVNKFLPFIELEDLQPEMAGIRPKLSGPGESPRDFVLRHEKDRGLPGFIDLVGIESPGLTSAPAIADLVEGLVKEIL